MLHRLGSREFFKSHGHSGGLTLSYFGGKTWTAETVVADAKDYGEVAVGKGLDATGLW